MYFGNSGGDPTQRGGFLAPVVIMGYGVELKIHIVFSVMVPTHFGRA